MKKYQKINIESAILDEEQLKKHLEKMAMQYTLRNKSSKSTYPIPSLLEEYNNIKEVYNLLNEHIKLGINIHPAGEWILDNFYIIEEVVRQIQKEMTIKKYTNFIGVQNGKYAGFARIYVLATEIVAYTDNKIRKENLEKYLEAYQTKKTLTMEEIWNIGIFLQIAIIQNINEICEKIYSAQIQKYKVRSIIERLVEKKAKNELQFNHMEGTRLKYKEFKSMKYPFIEYMSYSLKKYGKKAYGYLNILEEEVEKTGITVLDAIQKEHFDTAIRKISMANSITSIKKIQRINFLEIFEDINGVEGILNKDPANIYPKMEYKTKEYYRNAIKEMAKKTKISEIYIAKKAIELCEQNEENEKKSHIGYYLINEGKQNLYEKLEYKEKEMTNKNKISIYICSIVVLTMVISLIIAKCISQNYVQVIFTTLILLIPISEIVIQTIQYILGKIIKPKLIPKMDFSKGIDKQNATFVVIPTIIKDIEKVNELFRKLEVYYLANKSPNLYFAVLGDCSESENKEEEFDKQIEEYGIKVTEKLNEKYQVNGFPIFHFIYRERKYNESEQKYLGWERKRGLLTQFNEYILKHEKNKFRVNTINQEELPQIKYVITLDSDTDLVLNTAFELVGAMSHILNKPEIDKTRNVVVKGHAIMQPRIGINLDISNKNLFAKIFAGAGGIDSYTNAISDTYQDNFNEGIFTGKGIYDVKTFSEVLKNEIPENTVLSHDLLEGNYLRCALVSDIMLMDGYPLKYASFINRLSRWIRGDWQITKWLNSKLNTLSKFKIFDNLRRSLFEISLIILLLYMMIFNGNSTLLTIGIVVICIYPFILEVLNLLISRKEGEKKQKTFTPHIDGLKGAIYRATLTIGTLPHKAYISIKSIIKTIYRMTITHKNLLEWMTSEEAEKQSVTNIQNYYKMMFINVLFGTIAIIFSTFNFNVLLTIVGVLWIITPYIMYKVSKIPKEFSKVQELNNEEKEKTLEIAKRTWGFFKQYITEENNYLITDNYQEGRKTLIVPRTSSTNIGLSMLAVISSYDLGFESLEESLKLLKNIINSVYELPKWKGHLYNWYNIKTRQPLIPRYVSTVDSGNLIGYMYTAKSFLEELKEGKYQEKTQEISNEVDIQDLINKLTQMIEETDFKILYSNEQRLFSIGFNIEENKLTDSYYDLLASEARQASLVAIAKKDVEAKHWNNLSRTLTVLKKYKGLISWSGTAFEYLMPNINIPTYKGSLLDESCQFLIMNQIQYSQKLGIPWGISESAFNLRDLHSNYQYKAFGIPWLGLKRGLADDMVVSSYGTILAITEKPKEVLKNLKNLEDEGMYDKYGFYESIDYTPERVSKGKISETVKTYMAHHQALILLSINNLINDKIFQKRFMKNPEIEAVSILLQERMPETFTITKENKEKPEKIKYQDYENYTIREYNRIDERIIRGNVIGNERYNVIINQLGEGVSKFDENYINRFKKTDDYKQGIFFYVKDIETNEIWSATGEENSDKFTIQFMPDENQFEKTKGEIKTKFKITVDANDPVEIRRLQIENNTETEKIFEITSYFEPVLSKKEQDYAHQAFNNLFLVYEYDEENNNYIVKRRNRELNESQLYLIAKMQTNCEKIGETEFEINKEKFIGRNNLGIPTAIKNSTPLSRKIGLTTEGVVALKNTVKVKPGKNNYVDLILSVEYDKQLAIHNAQKYDILENITREFEIVKAKTEAESRYLEVKGRDIDIYQTIASYLVFDNPIKKKDELAYKIYEQKDLWKYGISGDLPIITVTIKYVNDLYVVKQMIKAFEYLKTKNVPIELVIIDEENYSYENYIRDEIESAILNSHLAYLKNSYGGIFVLSKSEMDIQDVNLIKFVSQLVIDSHLGNLENIINDMEEDILDNYRIVEKNKKYNSEPDDTKDIDIIGNNQNLKYYNEYGAFSEDGKEYIIRTNNENKIPTTWSHIMANKNFGTVVTEGNGGYTWYKNSRLNRVTSWHNSAAINIPSEAIYLKDEENGRCWSPTAMPKPDDKNYNTIYGFGYAKYIHNSNEILQELEVFVPREDSVKINILTLKNNAPKKKKIKVIYYVKPVLAEDEIKSDKYLKLQYEDNSNVLIAKNLYKTEGFSNIAYISSSEKIQSYTGNKKTFFGRGGISNPVALNHMRLDNDNGIGKKTCMAIEIEVEIESFSDKKISIILGADDNIMNVKDIAYKYSKIQNCIIEYDNVKNMWNDILGRIQVNTPYESINIMLNGWAMYQTMSSRLLAKSGFYQSGGAYGYRDQLQDTFCTQYIDSKILYNQIIKHSKHQFIQGDVEHWWHEENNRGIRTKFSDDLLWLPYSVIQYTKHTGDYSILDIETPYLEGKELQGDEKEKYDIYLPGEHEESIYEHCKRAIDRACNFGFYGLPKIGIGDWNDGLSNIGPEGKGESVWLGFFLYDILKEFVKISMNRQDNETSQRYKKIMQELKDNLNKNAWDGRWFKRAFADNGDVYGSMENEECRIDGISQSWSVISNAGEETKQLQAMESLENHLIDKENGIIKLLDPPFEKSKLEPGYIKSYLPGVRENGGQYTHGAIWAIIAEAMIGKGDKAVELYKMINPIEHSRTRDAANKYKVEPYVIAADIYGAQNLAGSGGWTWYTGSSSWYYLAGIRYILGLKIYHNTMSFEPCIPKDWEEYSIRYKYGESIYNIRVKNPNRKNTGVSKITVNSELIEENKISLDGSGRIFNIEVEM
ncbi:MAG: hypothetical protein HFJ55_05955 [Clostridia bacterium]|nr:hypothetical protein [Clostridia bacterium]